MKGSHVNKIFFLTLGLGITQLCYCINSDYIHFTKREIKK